ncbi:MAG: FAD-dependent thymidylate synthase [Candidatus Thorarchaeota archaeon]|jgi:thymidylate synthase (FAD)
MSFGIAWGERTVDHAWNEISGRYGRYVDFYHPKMFRQQSEDNKQASTDETVKDNERLMDMYESFIQMARMTYNDMLTNGVAREQARMVLPVSFYTEVIWTTSLQAVLNFILLRDHPHAQWEIQQYAKVIKELTSIVAPKTIAAWVKHRS